MLSSAVLITALAVSGVAAFALLARTLWALNRFAYRPVASTFPADAPSVSVCIAARNETHSLAQCLERILKSDYQKLEILVLDDSSDDDTSLIIKSFAGAGVRFIAGKPLPEGWLGKNHAYQTLIDEASGDLVLFLDVDTTILPTTITQLVTQLLANNRSMLSVLPLHGNGYQLSGIFGTFRYYWELLLASKASPAAASALWMAERQVLQQPGVGIGNYGLSVRPERHLARQLQKNKNYYYLIGTRELGVGFAKRLSSQYETARRLYYPMTGRTAIGWLLNSLFLVFLLVPLLVLLVAGSIAIDVAALIIIFITSIAIYVYSGRSGTDVSLRLRALVWPLIVLIEIILLSRSYIAYLSGHVTWKGRAVTAKSVKNDDLRVNE